MILNVIREVFFFCIIRSWGLIKGLIRKLIRDFILQCPLYRSPLCPRRKGWQRCGWIHLWIPGAWKWNNFVEDRYSFVENGDDKTMLFAEPQELLRGHVSQNEFQPGDLDALLSRRHKKSQRMLIFPKWDWWTRKLLKVLKTRATGSWLEWTQWLVIHHKSCKWVRHLFSRPHIFFATLFLSVLTRFFFGRMRFLLSTSTTASPSLFQVLLHYFSWECWNDDWHCIVEDTSSA